MSIFCGQWVTFGQGDSVPCGKIDGQTGKLAQCEPCQIAMLTGYLKRAINEADAWYDDSQGGEAPNLDDIRAALGEP